jgi:hypothetical protein
VIDAKLLSDGVDFMTIKFIINLESLMTIRFDSLASFARSRP